MFDVWRWQQHTRSAQYHHDHPQSNDEHQGQDTNDDIINALGGGRREQQFIKVQQKRSHRQECGTVQQQDGQGWGGAEQWR
jgi:hypothetical protein